MPRYELLGFNTDMRYPDDVRWRGYTTSTRQAERFAKIAKIPFSDSGHGIVFIAREMRPGEKRKAVRRSLSDHVNAELARIRSEEPAPEKAKRRPPRRERLLADALVNVLKTPAAEGVGVRVEAIKTLKALGYEWSP